MVRETKGNTVLESIEKQVKEIMDATVAGALGNLAAMAVILEGAENLTAEGLVDYARSMAKLIGQEGEFVASYASTLQTARDTAAKGLGGVLDRAREQQDGEE